jgi:hypothetical protein
MKDVLKSEWKHMLWKDEVGDYFLLTKYAEIYEYDSTTLRMHVFRLKNALPLREKGLILNEIETDEDLYIWDIHKQYLPLVIALGEFKRRPNIKGKWIKRMEKILAHKIIPFNPKLNDF